MPSKHERRVYGDLRHVHARHMSDRISQICKALARSVHSGYLTVNPQLANPRAGLCRFRTHIINCSPEFNGTDAFALVTPVSGISPQW